MYVPPDLVVLESNLFILKSAIVPTDSPAESFEVLKHSWSAFTSDGS